MKKILFVASAGLFCLFTSCNSSTTPAATAETKDNSKAQKNLDASHAVNKAFETGDVGPVDSVIADDFVDHTDKGDVKGKDSLKAMIVMSHKDSKNMKMEVVKELADDDYVFALMHFSGTSDGTMMPTKGPYDMHSMEVIKFRDGKATEHWEYMNPADMMKMMPPAANMSKKDADKAKK
jgi:predicted SnoaL-like aldol condensation-catalyzing enzyme